MITRATCDRCGREVENKDLYHVPIVYTYLQLCSNCKFVFYRQAVEFIKAFLEGDHNG